MTLNMVKSIDLKWTPSDIIKNRYFNKYEILEEKEYKHLNYLVFTEYSG